MILVYQIRLCPVFVFPAVDGSFGPCLATLAKRCMAHVRAESTFVVLRPVPYYSVLGALRSRGLVHCSPE